MAAPYIVSMKSLLEAGVHFGHRTRRWNPKMKPFIFTERNGIHIIDLQQTIARLNQAYELVKETVTSGGTILIVGTKRQAQESVIQEATRVNMPYVQQRWLGGTLTNWRTIRQRIDYLLDIEKQQARGEFIQLIKKEALQREREITRLNHRLGGLKEMRRLPNVVFIVDVRRDSLAVREANILGIPIIAMVDTNCDPDPIDYVIPSNDDAIRAIKLIVSTMADAVLEGRAILSTLEAEEEEAASMEGEEAMEHYLGPSTLAKIQAAEQAAVVAAKKEVKEVAVETAKVAKKVTKAATAVEVKAEATPVEEPPEEVIDAPPAGETIAEAEATEETLEVVATVEVEAEAAPAEESPEEVVDAPPAGETIAEAEAAEESPETVAAAETKTETAQAEKTADTTTETPVPNEPPAEAGTVEELPEAEAERAASTEVEAETTAPTEVETAEKASEAAEEAAKK